MTVSQLPPYVEERREAEAEMKPLVEKVIVQYQRGLLTAEELADETFLISFETRKKHADRADDEGCAGA